MKKRQIVFGTLLLAGLAMGQTAGGLNSPANVPAGYAITPFGYFHPGCVQRLAKGERLLKDGRVQHADGTSEAAAATCNSPSYTAAGLPQGLAGAAAASPEVNGWIENANIATGALTVAYGALIATWRVPPQPQANDGQVLFFFPGLEDINDTQSILQPVLQWYQGQWTIASWNCCLSGIITSSPQVKVNTGDLIYGSITSNCGAGSFWCSTWNVLSLDLTTGDSTELSATPSDGQIFNWAFGGVMEPYYVVSCQDYPMGQQISFDQITLFDEYLRPIAEPQWSETFNSTTQPQCGYGVEARPHEIALRY